MAWTAPRTWVTGEVVTAALMNTHVRDNTRYLKGLDGVPTIESGLVIDNTGGDEYLKLPLLSTAECTSVLDAEGEVAFDEDLHYPKYYDGSAIKALGGLTSKIASETRDMTAASGDVSYTGYGFQPTVLIAIGCIQDLADVSVWGISDSSIAELGLRQTHVPAFSSGAQFLFYLTAAGAGQYAVVKTYDSDGFTLTWTKQGTPGANTAKLEVLALR